MCTGSCRKNVAVALFIFVLALWPVVDLSAQDEADRTLTILAMDCPAGYTGQTPAVDCDMPARDVVFRVGRPQSDFEVIGSTDDEGHVQFEIAGLPLRGTIRVIENRPPETERFAVGCVNAAGDPLEIDYEDIPQNVPPIAVANVTVGDVGDVHCNWYNVPAAP